MFLRALSSFEHLGPLRLAVVVQEEHLRAHNLSELLTEALPSVTTLSVPAVTRGAAETALTAKAWLDPNEPMVVMDCDLWFASREYESLVRGFDTPGTFDAALLTFPSSDARYSYARTKGAFVVETAEKQVISPNAITGAYAFRTGQTFTTGAEALMNKPIAAPGQEYYMSAVYNELLALGKTVGWARVDEYASFGTPEELAAVLKSGAVHT